MRRLALVGPTRLNLVIRTNRDVQLFLQIPIEIPKKNTETAVRILEPTLIGGRHVLTRLVQRLHGQLSGLPVHRQRRPHERPACEQDRKPQNGYRRPPRALPRNLLLTVSCIPDPDFFTGGGEKRKTIISESALCQCEIQLNGSYPVISSPSWRGMELFARGVAFILRSRPAGS